MGTFLSLHPAIHSVACSMREERKLFRVSLFLSFCTFHRAERRRDVTGTRRVYRVNREASANSGEYVIAMHESSFRRFYNPPPASEAVSE